MRFDSPQEVWPLSRDELEEVDVPAERGVCFDAGEIIRWFELRGEEHRERAHAYRRYLPFANPWGRPSLPHEIELNKKAEKELAESKKWLALAAILRAG